MFIKYGDLTKNYRAVTLLCLYSAWFLWKCRQIDLAKVENAFFVYSVDKNMFRGGSEVSRFTLQLLITVNFRILLVPNVRWCYFQHKTFLVPKSLMLLWPNGNIHPKSIDNGINLRTKIYAKYAQSVP